MMTLKDIAGYVTERNVWRLLLTLSDKEAKYDLKNLTPGDIRIAGDDYEITPAEKPVRDRDAVRSVGALAFYALMGVEAFADADNISEKDMIPRISSSHCSSALSSLIHNCLSHNPSLRPDMDVIHESAAAALAKEIIIPKAMVTGSGRSYSESLVRFWPEEMICILVFLLTFLPLQAQNHPAGDIPEKMTTLVQRCVDLRQPGNAERVGKEFDRDLEWTLLDEIDIDKDGECTIKDKVRVFGLNEICERLLKYRGGVINEGGRFVNGQDPRYKYSLIEVTAKAGAELFYKIPGRQGVQIFAVIPYSPDASFSASVLHNGEKAGESVCEEGIYYITTGKVKPDDSLSLTIGNESGKNISFIIVNYNSRD